MAPKFIERRREEKRIREAEHEALHAEVEARRAERLVSEQTADRDREVLQQYGLQVFPALCEVAQHPTEMRKLAARGGFFLRAARLLPPSSGIDGMALKDFLYDADEHFDMLAQHCGAAVVQHDWGLINKIQQPPQRRPGCYLWPKDYMLVARVQAHKDAVTVENPADIAQIESGITTYIDTTPDRRLKDFSVGQFATTESGLVMLDPDIIYAG